MTWELGQGAPGKEDGPQRASTCPQFNGAGAEAQAKSKGPVKKLNSPAKLADKKPAKKGKDAKKG